MMGVERGKVMMTNKDCMDLAERIRLQRLTYLSAPSTGTDDVPFTDAQVATLAEFCRAQNPTFDRQAWMDHIAPRKVSAKIEVRPNAAKTKIVVNGIALTLSEALLLSDSLIDAVDAMADANPRLGFFETCQHVDFDENQDGDRVCKDCGLKSDAKGEGGLDI